MLKRILLGLIVLILLYAVTLLIMPGKVHIERSGVVNATQERVFDQVNTVKNWQDWSPWNQVDPEMKVTYGEVNSGVNASFSWDGPKAGKGNLKIVDSTPYDQIKTFIDFGDQGTADGHWTFVRAGETTKVTWAFETKLSGFSKLMRPMIKLNMGPALKKGIENIDKHMSG